VLPPLVLWFVALAFVVLARSIDLRSIDLPPGPLRFGVAFGVPAIICYTFLDRPVRYGLGLAALLLASVFHVGDAGRLEFLRRDFFGVHRVTEDEAAGLRKLFHGNTVHGMESLRPSERGEPLTYYCRSGPIGRLFRQVNESDTPPRRVAVVGLGAGSLVSYARRGQDWTFYEIDPVVVEVAQNQFDFLKDSRKNVNVEAGIVLGDARVRLEQAEGQRYDVLVIDAFNSDLVPVHLLTREALAVYRQRLTNDGILAFHISHRFLDFEPVLAALADDAGLFAYQWLDAAIPEDEGLKGKYPSYWVFMSPSRERAEFVSRGGMWTRMSEPERRYLWTDRYSNLLGIIRRREW
jgi:hypothetical protein